MKVLVEVRDNPPENIGPKRVDSHPDGHNDFFSIAHDSPEKLCKLVPAKLLLGCLTDRAGRFGRVLAVLRGCLLGY